MATKEITLQAEGLSTVELVENLLEIGVRGNRLMLFVSVPAPERLRVFWVNSKDQTAVNIAATSGPTTGALVLSQLKVLAGMSVSANNNFQSGTIKIRFKRRRWEDLVTVTVLPGPWGETIVVGFAPRKS